MKNSEYFQKVSSEIESLCKNVIEKYQSRFGAAFLDRHIFNRQVNNLSSWDFSNPEMMDALYEDEDFGTFDRYYKNLLKIREEERLVISYIANHLINDLKTSSEDDQSNFAKAFQLGILYADLSIFQESKIVADESDFFERSVRRAISNNVGVGNSALANLLTTPDYFEELQMGMFGKIIYPVDREKTVEGTVIFYRNAKNESASQYYRTIETMVSRVRKHILKHKLDPYNVDT